MEDLRTQFQRNAHAASLRRLARPQPRIAQRDGAGVVSGDNRLRAQSVSNEALGNGDAIVLSGDSGVGQQEGRRVKRRAADLFPAVQLGRVKILFSQIKDRKIEFLVAGHTKNSIFIKSFSENASVGVGFENTGRGKQDYIFAYKNIDTNTIGVIYGANPSQNWELIDTRIEYLNYIGNGFWASEAESIEQLPYPIYKNNSFVVIPAEELGIWNCSGSGRVSCTSYALAGTGNRSVQKESRRNNSGMPDDFDGTLFANATNYFQSEVIEKDSWVGDYGGGSEPALPGLPGQQADPNADDVRWDIDTNAYQQRNGETRFRRVFDSPTYCFCAFDGNISEQTGSQTIDFQSESFSYSGATWYSKYSYLMFPVKTTMAEGFYTWKLTSGPTSQLTIQGGSSGSQRYEYTNSSSVFVAPGVSKQNLDSFSEQDNIFSASNFYWRANFPSGYLYSQVIQTGSRISQSWDEIPKIDPINTEYKHFFNFNGQEFLIKAIPEGIVHQIDSEDFPSFVGVDKAPLVGNPNIEEPSIFSEEKRVKVAIRRKKGQDFQPFEERETREAKIYKIFAEGQRPRIIEADYC